MAGLSSILTSPIRQLLKAPVRVPRAERLSGTSGRIAWPETSVLRTLCRNTDTRSTTRLSLALNEVVSKTKSNSKLLQRRQRHPACGPARTNWLARGHRLLRSCSSTFLSRLNRRVASTRHSEATAVQPAVPSIKNLVNYYFRETRPVSRAERLSTPSGIHYNPPMHSSSCDA